MFEQSLPRPTTRTSANSILGGKVKGGEGEKGRKGGSEGDKGKEREGRGRKESYHVEGTECPSWSEWV